jgi:hypothetical protein
MIDKRFRGRIQVAANLYAYADSSKFPALPSQCVQKLGASLSKHRSDRSGVGGKLQFAAPCIDNANAWRKRSRQLAANDDRQRMLAAAPRFPFGEGRVGAEDLLERLHRDQRQQRAAGTRAGANEGNRGAN